MIVNDSKKLLLLTVLKCAEFPQDVDTTHSSIEVNIMPTLSDKELLQQTQDQVKNLDKENAARREELLKIQQQKIQESMQAKQG
jgi:predicted flavoprotein YhiN